MVVRLERTIFGIPLPRSTEIKLGEIAIVPHYESSRVGFIDLLFQDGSEPELTRTKTAIRVKQAGDGGEVAEVVTGAYRTTFREHIINTHVRPFKQNLFPGLKTRLRWKPR